MAKWHFLRVFTRLVGVYVCLSILVLPSGPAARAADGALLRVSEGAAGPTAATERALFWVELRDGASVLRRYDFSTGALATVAARPGQVVALAADGLQLVWAERDAAGQLGLFMSDGAAAEQILQFDGRPPQSDLALDGGWLYYTDSAPGHAGLFARELDSGAEQLISARGQRPVAQGGLLLWSEARATATHGRWRWSLHMRDSAGASAQLAEQEAGYRGFGGYDTDGAQVAWAFEPSSGDPQVYVLAPGASAPTAIGSAPGAAPRIRGRDVLWSEPQDVAGQPPHWVARAYNLDSASTAEVADAGDATLDVLALGEQQMALAVADDPQQAAPALYVADRQARGMRLSGRKAPAAVSPSACNRDLPASCGQLRVSGVYLADDAGTWRAQGVQLFLPQYGINSKSFRTTNYSASVGDGSLDYWLGKAQGYLYANSVRVFIEMPYMSGDSLVLPTDYATISALVGRANALGMRVGISLHNSSDWTMSAVREQWIGELLDYLQAQGQLGAVAYLSADNEINNHCSSGADCFDNSSSYVDSAVNWVSEFRRVVKAHSAQMLVTVGISTEMNDADNTRAIYNYTRADSKGRTLASLVDFVSPHNYGGGAAGIIDDLRYVGYKGPVLLEEFGFPTDPYPQDARWSEGAQSCRINPLAAACKNTAPYFVEQNLSGLRTRNYAGGMAWMLADMEEKDSSTGCTSGKKASDLWTGLFAIGGTYCDGGTYTRTLGEPKATAVRVCAEYSGDLANCEAGVQPKRHWYLPIVFQS